MSFTSQIASLIVNVVVNTQRVQANLQIVKTGLNSAGQAANNMQIAFAKIRTAAAGLYILKNVINAVDSSVRDLIETAARLEQTFIHIENAAGFSSEGLKAFQTQFSALVNATELSKFEDIQKALLSAAQAGITNPEELIKFTDTVTKAAAVSESLDAEGLAQFFLLLQDVFDRNVDTIGLYSNALSRLAMEFRTNEAEIVKVVEKITGTGHAFGLSEAQLLGWATAARSVGITAERASSSISQFMTQIATEPSKAATAVGLDPEQFKQLVRTNPNEALVTFLRELQKYGPNSIQVLIDAGFEANRTRDTLLQFSKTGETLNRALEVANEGMSNTASIEAKVEKQTKSLNASITQLHNTWTTFKKDAGDLIGKPVIESTNAFLKVIRAPFRLAGMVGTALDYYQPNVDEETKRKRRVAVQDVYDARREAFNDKGDKLSAQIAAVYNKNMDRIAKEKNVEAKQTEISEKELEKRKQLQDKELSRFEDFVQDYETALIGDELEIQLTKIEQAFEKEKERLKEANLLDDARIQVLEELKLKTMALTEAEHLESIQKDLARQEKEKEQEQKRQEKEQEQRLKEEREADVSFANILATNEQKKILDIEHTFDDIITKLKEVGKYTEDRQNYLTMAFQRAMAAIKPDNFKITDLEEAWKRLLQNDVNKETAIKQLDELQQIHTINKAELDLLREKLPLKQGFA